MSVNDAAGGLSKALKDLRVRWEIAGQSWQDQVRVEFEENHLEPLWEQTRATLDGMNRLAELLARARRECSS